VQFSINRPSEFDLDAALGAMEQHGVKASSIAAGSAYSMDKICLGHAIEELRSARELGGADVVIGLIRGKYEDSGTPAAYMEHYRRSVAGVR